MRQQARRGTDAAALDVNPLLSGLRAWAAALPDATLYVWLTKGVETHRLTFGELQQRSGVVAHYLQNWNVQPGDRVLLAFPPSSGLDFIVALFACLRAGAVAVPAYPPDVTSSAACEQLCALRRLATTCGARIALTDTTYSVAVTALGLRCAVGTLFSGGGSGLPTSPLTWRVTSRLSSRASGQQAAPFVEPPHAPHDVAFIQFSSGSTGTPKGVAVTHGCLAHNCALIRRAMGIDATCCEVSWLPLYHDMGLVGAVLAAVTVPVPTEQVLRPAPCVLMSPLDFLADPLVWVRAMSKYRATHTQAPDFAYALITSRAATAVARGDTQIASWDLSSLRCALNGAEVARADTMDGFRLMFGTHARCPPHALVAAYGLAESTVFVSLGSSDVILTCDRAALEHESQPSAVLCGEGHPGPSVRLVSCGAPPPKVDLLVVDPACSTVLGRDGAVGEIWLRSGSVAAGYFADPEATRAAFHAQPATLFDPSGNGYLRTGDLGFLWQGELFITGRLKDVLVLRGKKVAPQDVENTAVRACPSLRPGGCAAFTVDADGEAAAVLVAELRAPGKTAYAPPDLGTRILQAVAATHGVALSDVVFVRPRTVPKTTSGKVRRFECRQRYAEHQLDVLWQLRAQRDGEALRTAAEHLDAVASMSQAVRTRLLAAAICKHLGIAPPWSDMFASGLDSAGAAALHTSLERLLRVALPPATVFESGTPAALAAAVVKLRWPLCPSSPDAHDAAWLDGAPEQPAHTVVDAVHHKQQRLPQQRLAGYVLAVFCAAMVVSHALSMRTALPVSWWSADAARYVAHGPAFAPGWLPGAHVMDLAHWRMLEWTRTVMPVHLGLNAAVVCATARLCRGRGRRWHAAVSPRRITALWGLTHAALLHGVWALPPLGLAFATFAGTRAMLRVAEATTSTCARDACLHTLRCSAWVFILAAMLYFNLSEPGNALWPAVEQPAGAAERAFLRLVAFGSRTPYQGVLGATSFTANRAFRYMAVRLLSYVLDTASSPGAKPGRLLDDLQLFTAYVTYAPLYLSGPVMTFTQFKASAAALVVPSGFDPNAHLPDLRAACSILASAVGTAMGLEIALQTLYWPSAVLHPSLGGASAVPLRLTWCDHTLYAFLHLTATWASSACVFALPRGVALLQGVRVPNDCPVFWPQCSTSARAFWTHFHVSLSRWFTTYVYMPLGGGTSAVSAVMALSLHMHGFHPHWVLLFTLAAVVLCLERSLAARAAWYRTPGVLVRAANQTAIVMPMVLLACGGETLTGTALRRMAAACFMLSALQAASMGERMRPA